MATYEITFGQLTRENGSWENAMSDQEVSTFDNLDEAIEVFKLIDLEKTFIHEMNCSKIGIKDKGYSAMLSVRAENKYEIDSIMDYKQFTYDSYVAKMD